MNDNQPATHFAPSGREPEGVIRRQRNAFAAEPLFRKVLLGAPGFFMMLNSRRQLVMGNRRLLEFLNIVNEEVIYGRRPGELLGCIHAGVMEDGCGTSEFCSTCGAIRAILSALSGVEDEQECRITRSRGTLSESLDLRIHTVPTDLDGERFTAVFAHDISHEKRRNILERIFFHDVLNTAGAIRGFAEMLKDGYGEMMEEFLDAVVSGSNRLIMEIQAQKDLVAAENSDLSCTPVPLETLSFLKNLPALYADRSSAIERLAVIDEDSENIPFICDPVLLGRIIGNMLKNAMEASSAGETVTLACKAVGEEVVFSVHNPSWMPREVQLQVFERSFSTKGKNRGLGTYSMKLLSERYLKGRVWFTTDPEKGTTFFGAYPLKQD